MPTQQLLRGLCITPVETRLHSGAPKHTHRLHTLGQGAKSWALHHLSVFFGLFDHQLGRPPLRSLPVVQRRLLPWSCCDFSTGCQHLLVQDEEMRLERFRWIYQTIFAASTS